MNFRLHSFNYIKCLLSIFYCPETAPLFLQNNMLYIHFLLLFYSLGTWLFLKYIGNKRSKWKLSDTTGKMLYISICQPNFFKWKMIFPYECKTIYCRENDIVSIHFNLQQDLFKTRLLNISRTENYMQINIFIYINAYKGSVFNIVKFP